MTKIESTEKLTVVGALFYETATVLIVDGMPISLEALTERIFPLDPDPALDRYHSLSS